MQNPAEAGWVYWRLIKAGYPAAGQEQINQDLLFVTLNHTDHRSQIIRISFFMVTVPAVAVKFTSSQFQIHISLCRAVFTDFLLAQTSNDASGTSEK